MAGGVNLASGRTGTFDHRNIDFFAAIGAGLERTLLDLVDRSGRL